MKENKAECERGRKTQSNGKCERYKEKTQQDAGEFLCHLIDKLTEENKAAGDLFTAEQQNVTKCKGCGIDAGFEETFTILTLDIEKNRYEKVIGSSNIMDRGKSLESVLHNYSDWVNLSTGNEYYCKKCGNHQPGKRKTEIVYGPKIKN